jgi:hypothetical protein
LSIPFDSSKIFLTSIVPISKKKSKNLAKELRKNVKRLS